MAAMVRPSRPCWAAALPKLPRPGSSKPLPMTSAGLRKYQPLAQDTTLL